MLSLVLNHCCTQVLAGVGAMSMFAAVFVDSLMSKKTQAERGLELRRERWKEELRNDVTALIKCADVDESGMDPSSDLNPTPKPSPSPEQLIL